MELIVMIQSIVDLEKRLKTQDPSKDNGVSAKPTFDSAGSGLLRNPILESPESLNFAIGNSNRDALGNLLEARERYQQDSPQPPLDMGNLGFGAGIPDDAYPWEMIG